MSRRVDVVLRGCAFGTNSPRQPNRILGSADGYRRATCLDGPLHSAGAAAMTDAHTKISASHLKRDAYLYVRQSTVRQVFENQESTKRQYGLRQRAVSLGWPVERVIVIDSDLGQSGASTDREGFQRLVTEVGMGRAGIVLGLEVSRLARNSSDWHRLLEICALTHTLILDEDGVYDPCSFNDRLLLGLKGTMSEAELHVLYARLRGGLLNKAKRGELQGPLPVGLIYDARGRVVLEPDAQVQASLRHFFATYQRTGAARATVKALREQKVLMPRRIRTGARRGEVVWGPLTHWRALQLLHNPRYAGAFVFGRTARASSSMARGRLTACPANNGTRRCLVRTTGISRGSSTKPISDSCSNTHRHMDRSDAVVRRVKGQRFYKDSSCAASAALA